MGWHGLVLSVSASHKVGHGFASRQGHTKDSHKYDVKRLPALHAGIRVGVLAVQSDCIKGLACSVWNCHAL